MEKILEAPGGIQIEGENREVTILMVDIRGFTRMSATLPPSGIVALLNEVFRNVVGAIRAHGGTIDKYIGDMVMAVFNAPLDLEDHACKAVAASLDIHDRLGELNRERARRHQSLIEYVVVAHSGTVTAGSIGTPDRLSYTVIGQTVNVASRLEAVAKQREIPLLVSDSTWQLTHGMFEGEDLGEVELRDYGYPMKIWRVFRSAQS
ncbi:MAG: adenylate/guanylate cyclase domain-containing protein [Candidatus Omnitrophica bacterium]|nr:adenylate/guanylate cyclase domain-containing protein [Candidatus Omnitrophota bacterium]